MASLRLCPIAATLQNRLDPRDEFARAERFGDIVVPADFETQHPVDLFVARRKKQDRQSRCLADLAADVQAIHVGHANIEDDEIDAAAAEGGHRLGTVANCQPCQAGALEGEADHVADVRFVIDDENAGRHPSVLRCLSCLLLSFSFYLAMATGERR